MRVTVNDGSVNSAPVTSAAVTVVNSAPVHDDELRRTAPTSSAPRPSLDADATDADNDTLTYSATGLPTGASIAPATGVISGTLTPPAPTRSRSPSATAA